MDQTKSLQQMQAESGGASGTAPKMLNIEGIPENVTHALSVVQELLSSAPIVSASGDGDITNSDGVGDDIITEVINCPHNLLGLLIGKNGWTLKRIIRTSGANITINQSVLPNQPKRVIIYGKKENVSIGKALVERVLATSVPATNSRLEQKVQAMHMQNLAHSQQTQHMHYQNMYDAQMQQNQRVPLGYQQIQDMSNGNFDRCENENTKKYAKLLQLEMDRLRIEKEQRMLQSSLEGERVTAPLNSMTNGPPLIHSRGLGGTPNGSMYYSNPPPFNGAGVNGVTSATTSLNYGNLKSAPMGHSVPNSDIAARLKQMQQKVQIGNVQVATSPGNMNGYCQSTAPLPISTKVPIPLPVQASIPSVNKDDARTERYKAFHEFVQRQNQQKISPSCISTDYDLIHSTNNSSILNDNIMKNSGRYDEGAMGYGMSDVYGPTPENDFPAIYKSISEENYINTGSTSEDARPSDCSSVEEPMFFNGDVRNGVSNLNISASLSNSVDNLGIVSPFSI